MVGIGRNAFVSWLKQRISALLMLIISLAFIGFLVSIKIYGNGDISSWQHLCSHDIVKIILQIFFVMLVIHANVGMRDVYMDYVKCKIVRGMLYILTWIWLVICLVFSISIIWG